MTSSMRLNSEQEKMSNSEGAERRGWEDELNAAWVLVNSARAEAALLRSEVERLKRELNARPSDP